MQLTRYIDDLEFELPVNDGFDLFSADVKLYVYVEVVDKKHKIFNYEIEEVEIKELRDSEGNKVKVEDWHEEEVHRILSERGIDL
jgi:hypothetical protein